ncbi:MAG: 5-(carboxyamino)imidazole ribonucleotide synthase [Micavibrio sp. TMED27]|nr:5-(carboxyamino)imidazole ribonucleotide synthase [Micavibrio sp.]OUT89852.1 MAG: 5-(carboxyamino)imidazole ribonucleotide synthase [Micavibrio sp. TMED27]
MIKETKTIGILGGGQLGMMSAQAAKKIGLNCIIYTPETNSPASSIANETIVADYLNKKTLEEFASKVDVISYEFENIPVETIDYLANLKPVYPEKSLLEVSQDRIKEKSYLNSINIPTASWSHPQSPNDIITTLKEWGDNEAIIKTARFGYDGKGQERISTDTDFETLFNTYKDQDLIMEKIIDFDYEVSVIIARDKNGKTATYGPLLNAHKNHILDKTTLPAPIDEKIKEQSIQIANKLAQEIDLIGVLTVELFVTKQGEILANEIAPRTHNSGHLTIEACEASQFENHVRTVSGLDVASAEQHTPAIMINLIGDDILSTKQYEDNPNATIHNYGKTDVKPGRKMGHVTILQPEKK